ncbi:MAG: peptide deformylase [Bacteroidota bacterium]
MIYPVLAYGDPILKKRAADFLPGSMDLKKLVADMFETMYSAKGVGLAAPQVGLSIRVFVVDAEAMDEEKLKGFKKVFVNPEIIEETGEEWAFEEGCLSIPGIRGEVWRKPVIKIKYLDEDLKPHTETIDGIAARVIQHEYDHLEGKLFTEYLSPLKKRLLKNKLNDITRGITDAEYRMKFLPPSGRR